MWTWLLTNPGAIQQYRPNLLEISCFSTNQVLTKFDSQKVATRADNITSWDLLWTQDTI